MAAELVDGIRGQKNHSAHAQVRGFPFWKPSHENVQLQNRKMTFSSEREKEGWCSHTVTSTSPKMKRKYF